MLQSIGSRSRGLGGNALEWDPQQRPSAYPGFARPRGGPSFPRNVRGGRGGMGPSPAKVIFGSCGPGLAVAAAKAALAARETSNRVSVSERPDRADVPLGDPSGPARG